MTTAGGGGSVDFIGEGGDDEKEKRTRVVLLGK